MNNVRNLFQILCILAMVLSLTNCQNENSTDLVADEALQKAFPYVTSVLSQQEVESNAKLSTTMRNLATIQSQSVAENGTTYDFIIHTDAVKLIESVDSNAHSYTFPIERTNNTGSELENIVFSYDVATYSYNAHLVTYHLSAAQKQEFLQSQHISSAYDVSHQAIALNLSDVLGESTMEIPCTTIYTTYHITPAPDENTYLYAVDGVLQGVCEHEQDDDPCDTYTVIEIECPDGGSDGSGYDTTDNTSNDPYGSPNNTADGGGTTSNGGTNTTGDGGDDTVNVVTSPTSREEMQQIREELNSITQDGDSWEFSDNIPNDAPSFETIEELEAYINSLQIQNATTHIETNNNQPNQVTAYFTCSVGIDSFINLDVEIVQTLGNDVMNFTDYSVDSVSSSFSGFTFMVYWHQDSYSTAMDAYMSIVDLKGRYDFAIFYKGIGTIFDKKYIYRLTMNATAGTPISWENIYPN